MVSFEVISGPNAGLDGMGITDGTGVTTFSYVAAQGPLGLGTDTIEACFSDEQEDEVCDTATKEWVDTTPPAADCLETVNPHGKNVPGEKAKGKGQGVNPDGFYELIATDNVDPEPVIVVCYYDEALEEWVWFEPFTFTSGVVIKFTEAPGATPSCKKIGSTNGQAGAVMWHITLPSDPLVVAIDDAGNMAWFPCFVPPPPK